MLYFLSFPPSGLGRGLSLRGRRIDAIMIAFNQTHDQMERFLLQQTKTRCQQLKRECVLTPFDKKQIAQILC